MEFLLDYQNARAVESYHFELVANLFRFAMEQKRVVSAQSDSMLYVGWLLCIGLLYACVFTARCTLVQSAVLRSHVVCLSVCPPVCPSVCDVGGSGSHRFEILETNYTDTAQHHRSSEPKGHPPTPRRTWGNFGETRGGVGKNGVLEHKSGNISETCKDRGKVTMGSL